MTGRIGLVGVGWWAALNHLPTLADNSDARIVALCDRDPERLRVAGDRFAIAPRYLDVEAMLAAERLDGVIVSTPHSAHAAPAIAALRRGAHALIEKPMATRVEDARAIAQAARESGKQVMVPTAQSFTRLAAIAAQWVREGRVGRVRHATCLMGSALADLFGGAPMLETKDHLFRPPASTWADPAHGGGYGWGQLSHALGWLFHVADISLERVVCLMGDSEAGVDYYDAAAGRADNGATLAISGSATMPKHRGLSFEIRIFGTDGVILWDTESDRPRLELRRHDAKDQIVTLEPGEAEYDGALPVRVFAKLCAGEAVANPADAENGLRVVEAIDAMHRSAKSGQIERTR